MSLKFAYCVQINRTYTKRFRGRQFQGEITTVIFHQDLIENKPSLVQEHIGRVDSALALSSKDHEFESHWNSFF